MKEFYKWKNKYLLSQEKLRLIKRKNLLLKSATDAEIGHHRAKK